MSKVFGRGSSAVRALDQVSLEVPPGEFTCLIGASGCGKSTLLSLVAGLEQPTAGEVSTGGGRVAFMFQEPALFPWLTAAGNVELALRARGVGKAERRQRTAELLETVHLGGFGGKRPHQLSGGMRQRVALARALAQDADVLLMDEPFGALDAMTRDVLHDELDRICADRQLTVLFVTHNVREAVRLGDRVVVLSSRPGRVIAEFDVPIERPRRIDSAPVAELAARVTDRLREEMSRDGSWQPGRKRRVVRGEAGLAGVPRGAVGAARPPPGHASLGRPVAGAAGHRDRARGVATDPPQRLEEGASSPGPGATLSNLWDQLQTGLLWHAIATTAERAVIGFGLAVLIGAVIGALVSRIRPLRAAVGSLITGLQTMPSIAWFPFAIILFGISTTAILFVIILGAAPSIANGLIAGVDYTPPLLLKAGTMMGLRRLSLYRYLILPASLPAFVAGLKQGWAFAWRSLMAGELLVIIANQPSLGVLLSTDQDQSDMQSATAIIIVILILGIIVDHAVRPGRPRHPPPLGPDAGSS